MCHSLNFQGYAQVNSGATQGSYPNYFFEQSDVNYMGMVVERLSGAGPDFELDFSVEVRNSL